MNIPVRIFLILLTTVNLGYQVVTISTPIKQGSNSIIVNICYCFVSFISVILIATSFKVQARTASNILWVCTYLLCVRNAIRAIDFENTKQILDKEKWDKIFLE